ncbi:hypothetical protein AKJ44_02340 [candidate division MSBL1 archaeon SCGC-AAA261F17]|uniref:Uncharacterized protein n=1 Tax=candidate division MSBL1 archaeon SCGC-AAA261F17 TaxID=1698274 RepID=A0A133V593_9EURY|nr:hypothetical protein AKJ44_02340 [candidate division MSBL1 archaeon SCGC-AAA261F17]
MTENTAYEESLSHLLEEINISNIKDSLQKSDFKKLERAHDSTHEFMLLAPYSFPITEEKWHAKSAFLIYHWEAFHKAHRSLLEALTGHYNSGYILLRSCLENLLRGALWECLAHKKFREDADVIKEKAGTKIGDTKKTILDWINGLIEREPSIEKDLENTSGGIFDKIAPLFEDADLRDLIPYPKTTLQQLREWGILEAISNPVEEIYEDLYSELSADVHVIPDATDIGRRLLSESEENIFQVKVNLNELMRFTEILHRVIDIGIVIELNVLEDWIKKSEDARKNLRKRQPTIENLELEFSSEKLRKLI